MLKYFILFTFLFLNFVFAQDSESIILKDTSGLNAKEVRKKAEESDQKDKKRVNIADVIKSLQASSTDGTVNLAEIQALWKNLSPKAEKYDWIQAKSGEWFKGKIKSLYRQELEFDSSEVGLHTFNFDNIKQIKSYQVIAVNIDEVATFEGIVRYKDEKISIIQGDKKYTFTKDKIVSLAPEGKSERNRWSGKITIAIDTRSGNKNQVDFTARANARRLTSKSRLSLDYLGRYSTKANEVITSDNRINEKYDLYLSKRFFWTPLFSELYQDKFTNIQLQATAGVGLGYILVNKKGFDWDVSGGPAYVYTQYYSVEENAPNSSSSAAAEFSTKLDYDITKKIELIFNYKLTLSNQQAGTYKHHMVTSLENEITSWLDIDITYIWDYILNPEKDSSGNIPKSNDHQVLIGFGVEF